MSETLADTPGTEGGAEPRFDRRMLEILVCPVTLGPLRYDVQRGELVSAGAGLAFPLLNGIPLMLVEEARRLRD